MRPRVMVTFFKLFWREISSFTEEPSSPLISFFIWSLPNRRFVIEESPTFKMRSPTCNPALSLGPSGTTYNTFTVSLKILNSIPMPSKLPIISSLASLKSIAGI